MTYNNYLKLCGQVNENDFYTFQLDSCQFPTSKDCNNLDPINDWIKKNLFKLAIIKYLFV